MSSTNDQLQLQRQNSRAKITLALRRCGPMSRIQLTEAAGLSVACVGKVVNELLQDQELVEVGNSIGQRGRPKAYYDINPAGALIAGVLLSAGSVQIVVAKRNGEIASRETLLYKTNDGFPSHMMEAIADAIQRRVKDVGEKPQVLAGVGVSVAGMVDPLLGVVQGLTNRRGWEDVPVAKLLEDRLGVPVFADNNARAAALHDHWFGSRVGEGGVVYLYVGEGVGGAYIDDRGLLRGVHNSAGFFGHMTIEPDGPVCACGSRGCLEILASDIAFIHSVWPGRVETASDLTFSQRSEMVKEGIEKARLGDLRAARALVAVARYVGIAVANIVAALDPRTVHIYGTMTDIAQDRVVDLVRREAMQRIWPDARGVEIKALTNYEEFLLRGAIGLVLSRPYRALRDEMNEVSAAHYTARVGR
ncbi:MAG: ROK family transcriptional regulator [Armatimonadota bacterium]